jgi:hypothetical protein
MTVTFEYDHSGDKFVIGHHQDCTAIIDDNKKALLDVDSHRKQSQNDWAHYAKVPNIVIMEWRQKYGVDFFNRDHWPRVMALVNSRDYQYLKRTTYHHDR